MELRGVYVAEVLVLQVVIVCEGAFLRRLQNQTGFCNRCIDKQLSNLKFVGKRENHQFALCPAISRQFSGRLWFFVYCNSCNIKGL